MKVEVAGLDQYLANLVRFGATGMILSSGGNVTLRFPVGGIEDYVPDVQRGQWSPQALVDQAKLRTIDNQPGRQG